MTIEKAEQIFAPLAPFADKAAVSVRPPFGAFGNDAIKANGIVQACFFDHRFAPVRRHCTPNQDSPINGQAPGTDFPIPRSGHTATGRREEGRERRLVVVLQLVWPSQGEIAKAVEFDLALLLDDKALASAAALEKEIEGRIPYR